MLKMIKSIEGILKGIENIVSKWDINVQRAWLHGFIVGDVSYTCLYTWRTDIAVETTHIGTLLSFSAVAYRFSHLGYVRVYSYPRRDQRSYTVWKLRAHIHSRKEHDLLCSKTPYEILDLFSKDINTLSAYTAGFMDSDGTIVLSVKKRYRPKPHYYLEPEIIIVDKDRYLLELLKEKWTRQGIHGNVQKHPGNLYRYRISAKGEIFRFLNYIVKYMLNIERLGKAYLLMAVLEEKIKIKPKDLKIAVKRYNDLLAKMKNQANQLAKEMYKQNKSLVISKEGIFSVKRVSYVK